MAGQRRSSLIEVDDEDFLNDLAAAFKELELEGEKDVTRIGLDATNRMRQLCPVDTGRLRSSLGLEPGRDQEGFYVEIGTDVEYAAPVEFGHVVGRQHPSHVPAQPFIRPALAEAAGLGGGES